VPSKELADQVILYTGLANIEPGSGRAQQVPTPAAAIKSAVKKYLPNDIVFARMRPTLRKVALMSFEEGGYVSPECSVLSVRQDARGEPIIAPELLASILRSDLVFGQVAHLVAGIGRPRLNVTDLRSIRLPLPPLEAQLNAKAALDGHRSAAARLRSKAAALIQEAEALESNAVNDLATRIING
jgi:hypothetical protein